MRIKTSYGIIFEINDIINDTIKELQSRIHRLFGVPEDYQELSFKGNILDDYEKRIVDYLILQDSTIYLNIKSNEMFVFVKSFSFNDNFYLEVKSSDTIENIKIQIHKRLDIPIDPEQKIFFKDNQLDDNKTLTDYNIKKGDIFDFKLHIVIKSIDGNSINAYINTEDKIEILNSIIKDKINIPDNHEVKFIYDDTILKNNDTFQYYSIINNSTIYILLCFKGMSIYVRSFNGKMLSFDVQPFDSIEYLREKIIEKGTNLTTQKLLFNNNPLYDGIIGNYNIKNKSVLDLSGIEVKVKIFDEKTISFIIDPSETILQLKNKIKEREGIQNDDFLLYFHSSDNIILEDNKTINEYANKYLFYYNNDFSINLIKNKIKIYLKLPNNENISLEVSPFDNPYKIKREIKDNKGIYLYDYIMASCIKGDFIRDKVPLIEYDFIKNESRFFFIETKNIMLFVKTPSNKTIYVEVHQDTTIGEIKEKILDKEGIPIDDQRLIYCGKQLDDYKNVDYYRIRDKSIIQVILRLRGGNINAI